MRNSDGFTGRIECARNDHSGDVVNGDHVDCVVNVGTSRKLDTSLDHSDKEVVGVGSCRNCR